jgi:hypothetical protein
LSQWQAFDAVDPLGAWRLDYGIAMLCALQVNMNRKKGTKPISPQEFMAFLPDDPDAKMAEQEEKMRAFVTGWNSAVSQKKPTQ